MEEQVHSEAEGYVDAVEQVVAREFVASASDLQHVPRTNPSSEVCSEKTDSAVAQSLAKEATLSLCSGIKGEKGEYLSIF